MTGEYALKTKQTSQNEADSGILQRTAVRSVPATRKTPLGSYQSSGESSLKQSATQIPAIARERSAVQPKLMLGSRWGWESSENESPGMEVQAKQAIATQQESMQQGEVVQQKEAQLQPVPDAETQIEGVAELAIQRKGTQTGASEQSSEEQRPNKTGLPDGLKTGIENLSGYSMDDVRVHRSSALPARIQAAAYARGTDIHVGPGQERHLPHEAWHVVQQKQGRVKATEQFKGVAINDNAALEREADMMGKTALQYGDRSSGVRDNQQIANLSAQTGYSKVAQLQVGDEKIEEIKSRVFPWATSQPDCLKVSKQLWNNLKTSPIEGQTEVKLAKYVWWRGKGNDKGGRIMTTDGQREILTGQSHVAVKATIDSSTYIIDVTIGQFMRPKEAEVFVGTVEEWEQRLMELTDGRQDTIERNAVIAEGFESFAKPNKPLDEARYVDELTAYKLNQVPGQKKYGDKKKGKTGGLKSKLPFFKKS